MSFKKRSSSRSRALMHRLMVHARKACHRAGSEHNLANELGIETDNYFSNQPPTEEEARNAKRVISWVAQKAWDYHINTARPAFIAKQKARGKLGGAVRSATAKAKADRIAELRSAGLSWADVAAEMQQTPESCRCIHWRNSKKKNNSTISVKSKTIKHDNNQIDFDTNYFELDVISSISESGWILQPQISIGRYRVDIGVLSKAGETKYLCGIECDGATYHSGKEKQAKDAQRQNEIESMGLKVIRIWSTDWFKRKDDVLRETLDLLDRLSDGIP